MRVSGHRHGFSLIEATVAVAVLALGCLTVTSVLHTSLGAEAGLAARQRAAEALDAESARLRALVFFRQSAGPDLGPSSVLSEVFPHARPALNTAEAHYVAEAGTFVTVGASGGLQLTRTAHFARLATGGPEALPAGAEGSWAVWDAACPPAAVLDVHLEVTGAGGSVTCRDLFLSALRPRNCCTGTVAGGDRHGC
jgi:hypothetical protein